jgi:hypothetical protein
MNRRRFLATVGAIASLAFTAGCMGDSIPGPNYPGGTLWLHNTAEADLSLTITTVDQSPKATLEVELSAGSGEAYRQFVSAPLGSAVTLRARVETSEKWTTFEFLPSGGGDGSDTPPQYARLDILGVDGGLDWSAWEGVAPNP